MEFLFFFQAEDGIRDIGVTGVQTCALPILPTGQLRGGFSQHWRYWAGLRWLLVPSSRSSSVRVCSFSTAWALEAPVARSEERRVGKEWRFRWSPDHLKKKN